MPKLHDVMAANLRIFVQRSGLTFAQLARDSGVHKQTVYKLAAAQPGFEVTTLSKIARVLGVNEIDFFRTDFILSEQGTDKNSTIADVIRALSDYEELTLSPPVIRQLTKIKSNDDERRLAEFLEKLIRN